MTKSFDMQKDLILREFDDLKMSVDLLKASFRKYVPYDPEGTYSPEALEYYDSLAFRFGKSVELFLNFFKGLEIYLFSKSSDTLRDQLLFVQKIELIDSIDFWMESRILRNKITHAYLPGQLKDIYKEIINKSESFFITFDKIEKFIKAKLGKEDNI